MLCQVASTISGSICLVLSWPKRI